MALTKREALRALGQRIRQRHGFGFDESAFLANERVKEFAESEEAPYQRFAQAYTGAKFTPGGHPDYDYLAERGNAGNTQEGQTTTLFLDLKNFTKYCCFLSREVVYKAKSAVIAGAIDVCRIYGGHLHEIPGDGVLFFYGRKDEETIDGTLQALQAACDAMAFLEEEIIPEYDEDTYPDLYPKMGLDFGTALWGPFGSEPFYEVKATGFNVDIASKMMHQCNSKEIAVGEDLKVFAGLDEKKYLEQGWKYERELTVEGEKKSVQYQTWKFDWRRFRDEEMDGDVDVSKLGLLGAAPTVIKSKSKLGDAPLA